MPSWRAIVAVLVALTAVLVVAVLIVDRSGEQDEPGMTAELAQRGERQPGQERQPPPERGSRAGQTVEPSHCPPEVPECAETEGEIFYVEAVDPDGDGDAHFVIWDSQSISLPGLTAIDLEKSMRPDPLPGPGDLVSAAGPVQTGSYGQSQIHALEFHVGR